MLKPPGGFHVCPIQLVSEHSASQLAAYGAATTMQPPGAVNATADCIMFFTC